MLTIFANMRINEPERLQHMKDSFMSFNTISDDWVINIRGELRDEAIAFLKENLGDKLTLFELSDDSRGWITNAFEMLPAVKHNYVLIWNEDHLNIAPQNLYKNIIKEMKENNVDYVGYSWWIFGESRIVFDKLSKEIDIYKLNYIDYINLTKKKWQLATRAGHPHFILSLCGIYKKNLFKKMLQQDHIKLPIFLTKFLFKIMGFINIIGIRFDTKRVFRHINKLFLRQLRRFPQETPFELERDEIRTDMLPLKIGLPKQELFACIDDDLRRDGYSLISRGLYLGKNKI